MTLLILSNIVLWIAVAVLAVICAALARQVGVLHNRIAPAGALSVNRQVRAGEAAPVLKVEALAGEVVTAGRPEAGRAQLFFFLSPECPVCKSLLPSLKSAANAERKWLDLILASDEAIPADIHARFIAAEGLGAYPYVLSEVLGRSFGVGKLPYAILINGDGTISSMGIVNTREHLESLFEAREQGVVSLQQYLARHNHAH